MTRDKLQRFLNIEYYLNIYWLIQIMGTQSTKINTNTIGIEQIKSTIPNQQVRFCPPFRKFKNQMTQLNNYIHRLETIVEIQQPVSDRITVSQQYFTDLEDAFDYKTKQLQLNSILADQTYIDMKTYIGKDKAKNIGIQLRPFSSINSHTFNNIIYEININQQIAKLNCPNLNTIHDKYIVQTGLQLEGQQTPNTQVYILENVTTNLSQMIRYRRQNNWPWTINQFNALASDLVNGLNALHQANISHNDIRPCNVFYSLQKNCYQLSNFANAIKSGKKQALSVSQVRASAFYGAPELSNSKQANFEQADIYSLGMTLLSAFYLCQPIDRKAVNNYNKDYQKSVKALSVIRQMILPIDKRNKISSILEKIPKGQNPSSMQHLISSLQYKNSPKDNKLVQTKKLLSDGYKRLGLWNDWKKQQYQAYQLEQRQLDDYKKAVSLSQLSKIQYCRGELQSSTEYSKMASKLFRNLGYKAYDLGNSNESISFFTRAVQCSKYFMNKYDLDTAKSLQGLALAHSDKGDYQISKPLINQAIGITVKNMGADSIDYCKIKLTEAKIESEYGYFEDSDRILSECQLISERKYKLNEQLWKRTKAQIIAERGKNFMKHSDHKPEMKQIFLQKAQRYLAESIKINEQFPENHLIIAQSIDMLGQIDLRKQVYDDAKQKFLKAKQLRQGYVHDTAQPKSIEKQNADTYCSIAACDSGIGNYSEALQKFNRALDIYRKLFGSDHNKFSAMAIGNMSKVYHKMNDFNKTKQCLRIATWILSSEVGEKDPDYEYFKNLEQTL